MNVFIAENINQINDICSFASEFNDYSVFQSDYFYSLIDSTFKNEVKLIACSEDNVVKGFMLIQYQNYFGKVFNKLARRAVIVGAPVFNDNESVLSELLGYYVGISKNEVVYTQIRNIHNIDKHKSTFEKYGFKYIDHLNYLIDLKQDIETIWKNVFPKRKNEIRKGQKETVIVSEIDYEKELFQSFSILKNVYDKVKLPMPDYNYFMNANKILGAEKILRIFGGNFNGKLIGVIYLLCFKGRVYNWYAASNSEYYRIYPNDVIMWEVIKWASENGFDIFDFGGAGHPQKKYGVRDFKKKFGGREVNFGRFELIHKPNVMKISEIGFKLWQKIK